MAHTGSGTRRKTILLISPYWKEQHRWMVSSVKLADLWQRIGYDVVVACMGPATEERRISPTLTVHTYKDFFLPDPWNYGIAPGFSRRVVALADHVNPDLIVVNKILFWTSFSLLALRRKGCDVLLLSDALVGITWWPKGILPKIAAALYAWTAGWMIMRRATRIILFHPQPQNVLERLGVAHKTSVIPTGIDADAFSTAHTRTKSPVVTYVGRLESVKGVDDFLAAAVPLKREFPSLIIRVVGWYKDRHPLVETYEKDAEFTGLRDDVDSVLAETDVFVLPSHAEGLSNALMEAMASGCACVASDVGGNAFLLEHGVSGLLFPSGDRPALTEHLRSLLNDATLRATLGAAARERIERHFDWKVVGERYQALFEEVSRSA